MQQVVFSHLSLIVSNAKGAVDHEIIQIYKRLLNKNVCFSN